MKNIFKNMIIDTNKDIDEWLEDLAYNVDHQEKPKLKKFKKDNTILKQPDEYKNYAEYLLERTEREGEWE